MSPKMVGYEVVAVQKGQTNAAYARFQCVECGRAGDFPLIGARGTNPENISKRANITGWVTYPFRKSRTYCPSCAGPSKAKNNPDSELEKVPLMTVTPIKSPELKEPTGDQRVQIRGHLDKCFDDAAGMYLDDMSDARIAELVGVPRVIVERMREAAYGPIKVDPIVAGLRNEMSALKRDIDGQQRGLETLKSKVAEIGSRLEKIATGRAA